MHKFYEEIMEYIKSIRFDDLEEHYEKCSKVSVESEEVKKLFNNSTENIVNNNICERNSND